MMTVCKKNSKKIYWVSTILWTAIAVAAYLSSVVHNGDIKELKEISQKNSLYLMEREWLLEEIRKAGINIKADESPVHELIQITLEKEEK